MRALPTSSTYSACFCSIISRNGAVRRKLETSARDGVTRRCLPVLTAPVTCTVDEVPSDIDKKETQREELAPKPSPESERVATFEETNGTRAVCGTLSLVWLRHPFP